MDAQLKKGLLEVCVLTAIRKEESYGYKIISDLPPCVEISESTLYPILKRLESSNAVTVRTEAYNGRLRKYFAITPVGIQKINDFLFDMQDFQEIIQYIVEGGTV